MNPSNSLPLFILFETLLSLKSAVKNVIIGITENLTINI